MSVMLAVVCTQQDPVSSDGTDLLPAILWKAGGVEVLPDAVDTVRITIRYEGQTFERTHAFEDRAAVFPDMPTGETVAINVDGLDGSGVVVFSGQVQVLIEGTQQQVTITANQVTPLAPQNVTSAVVQDGAAVQVSWTDMSSNEDGFRVLRIDSGTYDVDLGETAPDETVFIDSMVRTGMPYQYIVIAYNASGEAVVRDTTLVVMPYVSNSIPHFVSSMHDTVFADSVLYLGETYTLVLEAVDDDTGDVLEFLASPPLQVTGSVVSFTPTPADVGIAYLWAAVTDHKDSDTLRWTMDIRDTGAAADTLGPIAWYKLDDHAFDTSGNGYDGTLVGGSPAEDRFGETHKARHLNGTDEHIELPKEDGQWPSGDFTLSAWVNLGSYSQGRTALFDINYATSQVNGQNGGIFFGGPGVGSDSARLHVSFKTVNTQDETGVTLTGSNIIRVNRWTHVAAVRHGGQVALYIDGQEDASAFGRDQGAIAYDAGTFDDSTVNIGAWSRGVVGFLNGWRLHGTIDDVRIYDRGLDQAEIQALYGEGGWPLDTAADTVQLIVHYPLNGNADDISGFLRNGSLYGPFQPDLDRFGDSAASIFFGEGGNLTSPTSMPIDFTTIPFTVMFYVRRTNTHGSPGIEGLIAANRIPAETGVGWYIVADTSDRVNFRYGTTGEYLIDTMPIPQGLWTHYACVFSGVQNIIYRNGEAVASTNCAGGASVSNPVMYVGGYNQGWSFRGSIDDVRVYGRAVSAWEVASIVLEDGWIPEDDTLAVDGSGLMLRYELDGDGTDEGPNGLHGIMVGGLTAVPDRFGTAGQAMHFDGTGSVRVDHFGWSPRLGDFSAGAWVRHDSILPATAEGYVFTSHGKMKGVDDEFAIQVGPYGRPTATVNDGGVGAPRADGQTDLRDTSWHHLFMVREGVTLTLFVDGVADTSVAADEDIETRDLFTIGASAYDSWGDNSNSDRNVIADIDDARVYNRALSVGEVQAIYSEGGWPL